MFLYLGKTVDFCLRRERNYIHMAHVMFCTFHKQGMICCLEKMPGIHIIKPIATTLMCECQVVMRKVWFTFVMVRCPSRFNVLVYSHAYRGLINANHCQICVFFLWLLLLAIQQDQAWSPRRKSLEPTLFYCSHLWPCLQCQLQTRSWNDRGFKNIELIVVVPKRGSLCLKKLWSCSCVTINVLQQKIRRKRKFEHRTHAICFF